MSRVWLDALTGLLLGLCGFALSVLAIGGGVWVGLWLRGGV